MTNLRCVCVIFRGSVRRQFLCDMHSLMSLDFSSMYLFIYWFLPVSFVFIMAFSQML